MVPGAVAGAATGAAAGAVFPPNAARPLTPRDGATGGFVTLPCVALLPEPAVADTQPLPHVDPLPMLPLAAEAGLLRPSAVGPAMIWWQLVEVVMVIGPSTMPSRCWALSDDPADDALDVRRWAMTVDGSGRLSVCTFRPAVTALSPLCGTVDRLLSLPLVILWAACLWLISACLKLTSCWRRFASRICASMCEKTSATDSCAVICAAHAHMLTTRGSHRLVRDRFLFEERAVFRSTARHRRLRFRDFRSFYSRNIHMYGIALSTLQPLGLKPAEPCMRSIVGNE